MAAWMALEVQQDDVVDVDGEERWAAFAAGFGDASQAAVDGGHLG